MARKFVIGGISHETNCFSPIKARDQALQERGTLKRRDGSPFQRHSNLHRRVLDFCEDTKSEVYPRFSRRRLPLEPWKEMRTPR